MRLARPTVTGLVAALTLALAVPAASHAGYGRLSTVSVRADGGGTGGGASQRPSGSGDGHFLAFESSATNLVAGATDTNADFDVFLRDRAGGTTALVSHAYGMPSVAADAISSSPLVSGDSRWVAYVSQADDLVAGQSPGTGDDYVFLYDRDTGANVLVDHSTSSGPRPETARAPSLGSEHGWPIRRLHVVGDERRGRRRKWRTGRVRLRPHDQAEQAR